MDLKLSNNLKNILIKRNKINKNLLKINHLPKKVRKINYQQLKVIKKVKEIGFNNHQTKKVL